MKLYFFIALFLFAFLCMFFMVSNFHKLRVIRSTLGKNSKRAKKRRRKNNVVMPFIKYISIQYELDEVKLYTKPVAFIISVVNAFIISFTVFVVCMIKVIYILKLMIGFILLVGLMYSLYGVLASVLKLKGCGKDERK